MRRPLLMSLMVLGLVVTAVGGMGVFAPFTDRATTGPNTVTSGERPRAADLKLVFPAASLDCAGETYSDDTTTPGVTASNVQPGFQAGSFFCLRNAGSAALTVAASVIDLTDVDTDCTGDESAAGDATCGSGEGELAEVLYVRGGVFPCGGGAGSGIDGGFLGASPVVPFGTLAAGATLCGQLSVNYPLNRSDTEVLLAQSDTATWRYAFDGTTAAP